MDYKKIVAEAWQFTRERKEYIFWYGAIPAFFSTLFGIGYLTYQYFAFLGSSLFENWPRSFAALLIEGITHYLSQHHGLITPLIVIAIIMLIGILLLPPFCEAALIQSITRKKNGQEVRMRHGLRFGLESFLSLFEYKLLIKTVSFWSVLSLISTVLRNFGITSLNFLVPVLIITLLVALGLALLMVYSEYFLVIDKQVLFRAIGKSFNLVIQHLEETILLIILMIFIGARILIQIFFVFLIPTVAVGIVYIFTLINLPSVAWLVAGITSIIGLFLASYLSGTVNVFAITVWTFTFLKLTDNEELGPRVVVINDKIIKLGNDDKPERNSKEE